jgi:hypothetical protein
MVSWRSLSYKRFSLLYYHENPKVKRVNRKSV